MPRRARNCVKQFRIRARGARIPRTALKVWSLPKLKHRVRLRFAVIAALALLIAQLGAMTHAYTHVPQTRAEAARQTTPNLHDSCNDCLNFAPLLAAAGAPAALPFAVPQGCCIAPPSPRDSLLELKFLLAFRSRAPPAAI
jgi:hypothetical protein